MVFLKVTQVVRLLQSRAWESGLSVFVLPNTEGCLRLEKKLAVETETTNSDPHFIPICIVWTCSSYKQHRRLNSLKPSSPQLFTMLYSKRAFYNRTELAEKKGQCSGAKNERGLLEATGALETGHGAFAPQPAEAWGSPSHMPGQEGWTHTGREQGNAAMSAAHRDRTCPWGLAT